MRKPSLVTLGPLALLAALACQNVTEAPTGPTVERLTPSLAAAGALRFREVSAGKDIYQWLGHTCGVTEEDVAYCWGSNEWGQLGNGTSGQDSVQLTPKPVAGTVRFRSVSAGGWFSCGLDTGFRAHCWGDNASGQLGDGSTQARLTPTPVTGGLRFRQVVSGWHHACAIGYSDSLAYCWGENYSGQLGDRTNVQRLTPVPVFGGRRWRQLSAGDKHTCGITIYRQLYCWGRNKDGELGDSTGVGYFRPVRVAAGTLKFRQVSAGYQHTCAVSTADRAFCWGSNRWGALGIGKFQIRKRLWPVAVVGGLAFQRISAGGSFDPFTCGETILHRVYCWGTGGQLGDGSTLQQSGPVPVAGNLALHWISSGTSNTCGITATGVGYCWGDNRSGQLGDGTTTNRLTPVPVGGAS